MRELATMDRAAARKARRRKAFQMAKTAEYERARFQHRPGSPEMKAALAKVQSDADAIAERLTWRARQEVRNTVSAAKARLLASLEVLACEVCGWRPPACLNGEGVINVHHIVPVQCDGTNHPDNLAAVCPNCHAVAHRLWSEPPFEGRDRFLAEMQAALGIVGAGA